MQVIKEHQIINCIWNSDLEGRCCGVIKTKNITTGEYFVFFGSHNLNDTEEESIINILDWGMKVPLLYFIRIFE